MQKNFYQVPVDIETQALLQALRDGRLYIQPAAVPASDTRAEVLTIIARIADFACDADLVLDAWQALLADDARLRSFRLTQKQNAGALNRYRIAANVHYMCELGLYQTNFADMQECKSASVPCTFRHLCKLLFPGENADLYRRNCLMYSYEEDECIILNAVRHE